MTETGESDSLLVQKDNPGRVLIPNSNTESANFTEHSIGYKSKDLQLEFIKRCIENLAVRRASGGRESVINRQKIDEIIESMEQSFRAVEEQPTIFDVDFKVPEGFDLENQAKKALGDAVKIIYESGIFDRDILVDASRFAGPGNTKIIQDREESRLNVVDYLRMLDKKRPNRRQFLPVPKNKGVRNETITLEIGEKALMYLASQFLTNARFVGLDLDWSDALNLALILSTTHEYAHTIDFALDTKGRSTLVRAEKAGFFNEEYWKDSGFEKRRVHQEWFARGVEKMVLKRYMQNILKYPSEKIESLFLSFQKEDLDLAKKSFDIVQIGNNKGMNARALSEIIWLDLENVVDDGSREYKRIPDIFSVISYGAEPYSEDKLRQLAGKS
ncbi:MAG: hypothetical protein M1268_00045 [Patescibacteria group bacterium]|nr:hypothetical protein [Patescibacteria group bacterium]